MNVIDNVIGDKYAQLIFDECAKLPWTFVPDISYGSQAKRNVPGFSHSFYLHEEFNNKEKNASLNIFKNSSQQAISSPAVFRNIQSDTYITIKVIDDDKFKLIFRENYGIFILWLGLAISSSSFLTRVRK